MLRSASLWLQTTGDGIAWAKRILCQPVLIVDLDILDLRKLLEIQVQQIRNGVIRVGRLAGTGQINTGDPIDNFEIAVACEAIVDGNPSILIFLRGARAFEVFIEYTAI